MKRIIEGKLYDTETAERIASWGTLLSGAWTLYSTEKGNHFAVRLVMGGLERPLIPLPQDVLVDWLAGHGGHEVIAEHFAVEEA